MWLVPAARLSDASRSSSGAPWEAAAAGLTPSPGRDGRFTNPLAVRVGWLGSGGHGGDRLTRGRGLEDRSGGRRRLVAVRYRRRLHGPPTREGGEPGPGGQAAGGGCGAGEGGNASSTARERDGRMPCGGVTGAVVTASVVSRVGGMCTVAVTPLPGEWSSRT